MSAVRIYFCSSPRRNLQWISTPPPPLPQQKRISSPDKACTVEGFPLERDACAEAGEYVEESVMPTITD
jgi:hypothetical protein